MKTVIDICKINDLNCGLGQVALHLYNNLSTQSDEVGFYCKQEDHSLVKKNHLSFKKWHRVPFLYKPPCIVWHSLHQDINVLPRSKSIKKILTIHDLNYIYEEKHKNKVDSYLSQLQKKIDLCDAITYISEFTRDDVQSKLDTKNKIEKVIYNGICLDPNLSQKRPEKLPSNIKNYIFSIGTVVPKKNFKTIIDLAIEFPEQHFVLAGTLFHSYAKELLSMIEKNNLQDRVIALGEVSEEEKNYLYKNCSSFYHPSFLEGFGLPIIEAFANGKTVLCSNTGSLPEVAGGNATLFNPKDSSEITKKFQEHIDSINSKSSDHLKDYANKFSWKTSAEQYLKLYSELQA